MVITRSYIALFSLAGIMLFVGIHMLTSQGESAALILPLIMVYIAGGLTEHARLLRLGEIK